MNTNSQCFVAVRTSKQSCKYVRVRKKLMISENSSGQARHVTLDQWLSITVLRAACGPQAPFARPSAVFQ